MPAGPARRGVSLHRPSRHLAPGARAVLFCLLPLVAGCPDAGESETSAPAPPAPGNTAPGPLIENEDWTLLEMATAHDVLVIEVEAREPDRKMEIARALVEPIKDDYEDVLVYVYRRGDETNLPVHRIEWTEQGGYVEVE